MTILHSLARLAPPISLSIPSSREMKIASYLGRSPFVSAIHLLPLRKDPSQPHITMLPPSLTYPIFALILQMHTYKPSMQCIHRHIPWCQESLLRLKETHAHSITLSSIYMSHINHIVLTNPSTPCHSPTTKNVSHWSAVDSP